MQFNIRSRLESLTNDYPTQYGVAFGEALGIDVPTHYSEEIHATVNALMAADSLVTPAILGMSTRTVWFCRLLAGLLLVTRSHALDLDLRQRLEIAALT